MTQDETRSEAEIAADIGEKTGMGAPDLDDAPEAIEEKPESVEDKPESKPDKPEKPEVKAPEDKPDEGENEDDEDEGDKGEEDDTTTRSSRIGKGKKPERLVPYNLLKTERQRNDKLGLEIESIQKTLAEMKTDKVGKTDEEIDEIQKEAEALAKEIEESEDGKISTKALESILRRGVELAQKKIGDKELPKEIQDKMKLLDQIEKENAEKVEQAHFDNEWNDIAPDLRKEFPNAGEEQLKEAKALLDKLSHQKKYHTQDLDYIVYKNKEAFATILKVAGKTKSGETGKRHGVEESFDSPENDENLEEIENLTPEIMKARENRESEGRESSPKDYTVQNPQRG